MNPKPIPFYSVSACLVAAVLSLGDTAIAATFTWNSDLGGPYTGLWTDITTDGWNGGPPMGGDSATIDNGTVTTTANNQQAGVALTIGSAGVLNGTNYFYFSGGSLTLDSGVIEVSFGGEPTYRSSGLGATVTASSGTSFINNTGAVWGLALESGGTTFTGAGDLTIGLGLFNHWGGAAGITKSGTGTLTLEVPNGYTGPTNVDAGILSIGSGGANLNTLLSDSTAVSVASGAKIDLNFEGTEFVASLSLGGADAGTGSFDATSHPTYFTGSGKLFVPGGVIADNDGIWSASSDDFWEVAGNWDSSTVAGGAGRTATFNGALGTMVFLAGDLTIGNLTFAVEDYTIADTGKLLTLDAITPTINVAADRTTAINSRLTSTAEIVKAGGGTLVLNGRNESTQGMAVNGGTLVLARVNDNLSSSSSLTINNGGTVLMANINPMGAPDVTPVTINSGGLMTMSGSWSVNLGSLTLAGGELSSNGFFDPTYGSYFLRNDVVIEAGTSTISAEKVTAGGLVTFDVVSGGTLDVNGSFSSLYGSFGLIKIGDGAMVLSGVNDYIGNTWVDAGSLEITGTGSLRCKLNGAANNFITSSGSGMLAFNGALDFDLSTADLSDGNTWTVIEVGFFSSAPSFGSTFSVTSNAGAFTETSPGSGVWTLLDGDNNWTFTESSGVLSLAVASGDPFLSWLDATWPSISDKTPAGDPDNDGIENILEYVLLGGDPSVSNPGILPTFDASGANFVFSFTRRTASTTDTTQVFQYGNDLTGWTDVPTANGTYGDVTVSVSTVGDNDDVIITVPKGVNTRLFGRLNVSKP